MRKFLVLSILLISALTLQGCSDPGPKMELITGEIFRDDFDSETLADHWIVGPESNHIRNDKWSLLANPGYLTIVTQPADIHESSNNPINFFLYEVPYENFKAVTRLYVQPERDFEQAGLFLYNDMDNYARLARVHAFGEQAVEPAIESNAAYSEWIKNIDNTDEIYLKMTKLDHKIGYAYSIDGVDWISIGGNPSVHWDQTYAVLYAISPVSEREIDALFDYIEITELIWEEVAE